MTEAVESTWISSSGSFLTDFEHRFASVAGTTDCLGVSNGTVALHLALLALGAGPGDEIILPALTYIATANAVRYVGAEPVFVDVEPSTWCLRPEAVEDAITPKTVGVIAVDLYGHPADYDLLQDITARHGLWLVEDAAEAPYAMYRGKPAGSFGQIATFSFYGNKVLTSGEGGAVTSSDQQTVQSMRLLRGQGMDPERRYFFPIVGHNFRMTNIAAALLCGQLDNADVILNERRRVFETYRKHLSGIEELEFQPVADWAVLSPWLFSVLVRPNGRHTRDSLADYLAQRGIETRPFFIPLTQMPPYQESRRLSLDVTYELAGRGINLPTFPGLTESQLNLVTNSLKAAFE